MGRRECCEEMEVGRVKVCDEKEAEESSMEERIRVKEEECCEETRERRRVMADNDKHDE